MTEPQAPLLMYVEDEVLVQADLIDALEAAGFALVVASNGEQALQLLAENKAMLRGLVTDVNLGRGLTGWDVARAGRQANGGLAIVYVSGANHEEWIAQGVPGSTIIAKPFASAQVVVAISTLLSTSDGAA